MAPRVSLAVGAWTAPAPEQEVTAFSSGNVKLSLHDGPSISFTMPGRSEAALLSSGLVTDVWAYRMGALWQRCRMLPLNQTWNEDGDTQVTVGAIGYKRLIERRHIITGPPTFVNIDQGNIVWALVAATQATTGGSLGVTQGVTATGVLRSRSEYLIGDNLGKLLGDLSGVIDGVWWDVDANRVLTAKTHDGFPTHPTPLVLGGNVRNMGRTPAADFANVAGASGSKEQTVPAWAIDAGVAADPRGRWEAFDGSHSSTIVQATVQEHADGLLAERSDSPAQWTLELEPASYFEGDAAIEPGWFVSIVVPASLVDPIGLPPLQEVIQVTEISVGFDDSGATTVQVAGVEAVAP